MSLHLDGLLGLLSPHVHHMLSKGLSQHIWFHHLRDLDCLCMLMPVSGLFAWIKMHGVLLGRACSVMEEISISVVKHHLFKGIIFYRGKIYMIRLKTSCKVATSLI